MEQISRELLVFSSKTAVIHIVVATVVRNVCRSISTILGKCTQHDFDIFFLLLVVYWSYRAEFLNSYEIIHVQYVHYKYFDVACGV